MDFCPGQVEQRAASVRRSELISHLRAPCRGRTWCGWTVHTALRWSRRAAWEGRGSFWSPSSSPVTLGGSRSAFPGGWLEDQEEDGRTERETDSKWLEIWATHHNTVKNLIPKHRNHKVNVFYVIPQVVGKHDCKAVIWGLGDNGLCSAFPEHRPETQTSSVCTDKSSILCHSIPLPRTSCVFATWEIITCAAANCCFIYYNLVAVLLTEPWTLWCCCFLHCVLMVWSLLVPDCGLDINYAVSTKSATHLSLRNIESSHDLLRKSLFILKPRRDWIQCHVKMLQLKGEN